MIKNPNQQVIKDLVKGQKKANKLRNRILLAATILAAFVLTAVCSLGINYYQAVEQRQIAISGAKYDGSLNGPTSQQLTVLKQDPKIETVGLLASAGTVLASEKATADISLRWGDDNYWTKQKTAALIDLRGAYPNQEKELLLSRKALQKLKLSEKIIGKTIKLQVAQYDGTEEWREFTVSGCYQDYTNKAEAFVSQAYYQKFGLPLADLGGSRALITLRTPFFFDKDLTKLEKQLALKDHQWVGIDTEAAKLILQSLLVLALIGSVFLFCAFLVIYNILYISIQNDIHYFGLLRTIGTTSRQLKQIVNRQFMPLAICGTAGGLILGGAVAIWLVPEVLSSLGAGQQPGAMNDKPLIFILAALFTLLTVFLSSNLAAKGASQISPVAAVQYTGSFQSRHYSSKNGSRLSVMAWRNIFRNRKQAVLVLVSLFLGLTSFMIVASTLQNNDGKRILSALNMNDMTLSNKTTKGRPGNQVFDQGLLTDLRQVPGVKAIHPVTATPIYLPMAQNPQLEDYTKEALALFWAVSYDTGREMIRQQPEDFVGTLKGIDRTSFLRGKKALQLKISEEDFLEGKVAIASVLQQVSKEMKGVASINYRLAENGVDQPLSLVATTFQRGLPSSPLDGFYPEIFVSDKYIEKHVGRDAYIDAVEVDYDEAYDQKTEDRILALLQGNETIDVETKLRRYQDMNRSELQLKVLGYVLVAILLLLAVINYCNTISVSIFSRRRELALLESIGMTRQQQRKMLVLEGSAYWGISLLFTGMVGLPISYFVFSRNNDYQLTWLIPWQALLVIAAVTGAVCVLCPLLVYRQVSKAPVIERIR